MVDQLLLRNSLEAVLAMDDTFPRRFYEILFQRHPVVQSLFVRSTPGAQRKMFAQKLCAIVDHLDDTDFLARELVALRAAHDGYGVTDEMYPWVGEALIDTLREALGAGFTSEVERAWRDAYGLLSDALLTKRDAKQEASRSPST